MSSTSKENGTTVFSDHTVTPCPNQTRCDTSAMRSLPLWVVWHLKQAYCLATAVCWECVHVGIAWIHSFFISLITQSYSIIEQNTFRWSQAISQPIKTPFCIPSSLSQFILSTADLLASPFFWSLQSFIDWTLSRHENILPSLKGQQTNIHKCL